MTSGTSGWWYFLVDVVVVGLLAAVLVPVLWAAAMWVTPGCLIANRIISAEPPSFLGHLGEFFNISAIVDFGIWFAGLWGVRFLWAEFRKRSRERGAGTYEVSPARKADTVTSAVLCSLPVSFYAAIGLFFLFNRKRLPESNLSLAVVAALSIVACSSVILGMFSLAVKLRSRMDSP
jgi:hypothetical protein